MPPKRKDEREHQRPEDAETEIAFTAGAAVSPLAAGTGGMPRFGLGATAGAVYGTIKTPPGFKGLGTVDVVLSPVPFAGMQTPPVSGPTAFGNAARGAASPFPVTSYRLQSAAAARSWSQLPPAVDQVGGASTGSLQNALMGTAGGFGTSSMPLAMPLADPAAVMAAAHTVSSLTLADWNGKNKEVVALVAGASSPLAAVPRKIEERPKFIQKPKRVAAAMLADSNETRKAVFGPRFKF
ncbi:hypothetical protein GGF32_007583 [Allomyces javanicus]|nr:hypothetical protein GGF32_007583 [Allomyces javanicus]